MKSWAEGNFPQITYIENGHLKIFKIWKFSYFDLRMNLRGHFDVGREKSSLSMKFWIRFFLCYQIFFLKKKHECQARASYLYDVRFKGDIS